MSKDEARQSTGLARLWAGVLTFGCFLVLSGCSVLRSSRAPLAETQGEGGVCLLPIVVSDSTIVGSFTAENRYPIGRGDVAYYQRGSRPNWVVDYNWFRAPGYVDTLCTMEEMDRLVRSGLVDSMAVFQCFSYRIGVYAPSLDSLKVYAKQRRPSGPPPAVLKAMEEADAKDPPDRR